MRPTPALDDRIGLRLRETRTFDSGAVYLRYGAAGRTRAGREEEGRLS